MAHGLRLSPAKRASGGSAGTVLLRLVGPDQRLGLRHPFFALDATLEGQPRVHHGDGFGVPGGNLGKMIDAVVVQNRFKFRAYALDFLEIVGLPIDRAGKQPERRIAKVGRFGRNRRLRLIGLNAGPGRPRPPEHPLEQVSDKAADEKGGEQQQRAGDYVRRRVHELAFKFLFAALPNRKSLQLFLVALTAPLRARRTIQWQCRSARQGPETAS